MDPNATWTMLVDAYREEDWPQVIELSEALNGWLGRGGFAPTNVSQTMGIDKDATAVVVEAFCTYAIGKAGEEGSHAS